MELSWLTKLRIAAALAIGIVIIGILAWPIALPPNHIDAVVIANITFTGALTLLLLAFLTGLLAYFASWPYGKEIGIFAVPAGLAVWALRTGNVAGMIPINSTSQERQQIFTALQFEPLFWLAMIAVSFAAVLLCTRIAKGKPPKILEQLPDQKPNSKATMYLNTVIAVFACGLIALVGIRIFAQDVKVFDSQLGALTSQPSVGQIAYAVALSFAIAAFVVKRFLNVSYIWSVVTSAFITLFAVNIYARVDILQRIAQNWPRVFFFNAVLAILPIQMVVFGTIGSIIGYWAAIRFDYWRRYEI